MGIAAARRLAKSCGSTSVVPRPVRVPGHRRLFAGRFFRVTAQNAITAQLSDLLGQQTAQIANRPERDADAKFAERSALAATDAKHDVTRRGFLADRRGTDRAQPFAPPVSRKPGHCAFGSATVEASNGQIGRAHV